MSVFFEGELNSKIGEFRDRREKRLADRGLKFQVSHNDAESEVSDNGWVTIKGTHVLIDKDGNVQNGPGGLNGKRFNKATSTHFGKSAHEKAKEKHILEDTGMTPEIKGWLDEYEKADDYEGVKKVEKKIIDKLESLKPGAVFTYNDYDYKKLPNGKFKTDFSEMEFPAEDIAPMAITYLSGMSFANQKNGKYHKIEGLDIAIKDADEVEAEKKEEEKPVEEEKTAESESESAVEKLNGIYEAAKEQDSLLEPGVKKDLINAIDALPVGAVVTYNGVELTKKDDGKFYSLYGVDYSNEDIYSLCLAAHDTELDFSIQDKKAVSPEIAKVQSQFDALVEDIKNIGKSEYSKEKAKQLVSELPVGTEFTVDNGETIYNFKMALDENGKLAAWYDGMFYSPALVGIAIHAGVKNGAVTGVENPVVITKIGSGDGEQEGEEKAEKEEEIIEAPEKEALKNKQKEFDDFINKNKGDPYDVKYGIINMVSKLPVGTELHINSGMSEVDAVVKTNEYGEKILWYGNVEHSTNMAGVKVKNGLGYGVENPITITKMGSGEGEQKAPENKGVAVDKDIPVESKYIPPDGEEHWAKLESGEFINLENGQLASSPDSIPAGDMIIGDFSDEKGYDIGNYVTNDNAEQHKKNTEIGAILADVVGQGMKSTDAASEVTKIIKDLPVGAKIKVGKKEYEKNSNGTFTDNNGWEPQPDDVAHNIVAHAIYLSNDLGYEEYIKYPEKKDNKKSTDKISQLISNPEGKSSYDISSQIANELDELPVGSVVSTGKSEYVKKKDGYFKNKVTSNTHNSEIIADFMQKADAGTEFVKKIGDGYIAPTVNFGQPVNSAGQTVEKTKFVEAPTKASLKKIQVDESKYTPERKDGAFWDKESKGKEADALMREYTGQIWKSAPDEVKSSAHWYTGSGYQGINEAIRKGNYTPGGDGYYDEHIDRITELIDQSSYDRDIWVQRGISLRSAASLFGIKKADLENFKYGGGTAEELFALMEGKKFHDNAFQSCGSAKGAGFSGKPVIMNVYCPAGTKMMYAEPWSSCGNGSGKSWDGESGQHSIGGEAETILQRGTVYRPTKVSIKHGKIFVDVEVISQGHYIHSKKS